MGAAAFRRAVIAVAVWQAGSAWAQAQGTLAEVIVEADGVPGGYDIFDSANVTRGNLTLRETPQLTVFNFFFPFVFS